MTDIFSKSDVCSEISEDLSAFIDDELSKEQLAKVYEHLLECNYCRQAYKELKTTQKAIANYFKHSTEELEIPEKTNTDNIISKIVFTQKRRKIIYSVAVLGVLSILSYFSIEIINLNSSEKEVLHKVKFTKEKPALAPLPTISKEFAKKLKDLPLQKNN
ncbi:MAG: zf-HC2 domain-containing protein [bacterium]